MSPFRYIISFFKTLNPIFKWGSAVYSLLSFVALLNSYFPKMMPDWLFGFLPDWSVSTWESMFLVIVLISFIEWAFAGHKMREQSKERKLVGVEKWERKTGPFSIEAIALAFLGFLPIALMWRISTSPHLRITEVEVGWNGGDGRIYPSMTTEAPPDKQWEANVNYQTSATMYVVSDSVSVFVPTLPDNDDGRERLEDQLWDNILIHLKYAHYSTSQVPADSPRFFTIQGPSLTRKDLDDIANERAALYFIAVFADRHLNPIAGTCVYRWGLSSYAHECRNHNWP